MKGAPQSVWWRIDIRLEVRERACTFFHPRARSVNESRMPRIDPRRATAGASRRQELLHV